MSKNITLVFMVLLLFVSLTEAARPEPVDAKLNSLEAEIPETVELCEGLGEEECLSKRTLMAHIDYIYTQKGKGKGKGN